MSQQQQHQLPANNLNKYDFFEYGKPLTYKEMDYRSAVARGHRFYFPRQVPTEVDMRKGRKFDQRQEMIKNVSETMEEFPFKFPMKYEPRAADRTYQSNRPEFIKYFDERVRKSLVKPINEYQTTNFLEYHTKELPPEPKFVTESFECRIEPPDHIVYTNQKGDAKYLDPLVSTTTLDHIPFTEEMRNGLAKKDAITVWDWFQNPKTRMGFGSKKILPIFDKAKFSAPVLDREVPKRMKFVPNNSFQTESRKNYQKPEQKPFLFDKAHGEALTYETGIENKETEYNIIGSGKRLQSYLQAETPKIIHYKSGDCR